jgi:nucleotide-binding universal stress UspA family protein
MKAQSAEHVAVVGVDFTDSGDQALRRGLQWLAASQHRTLHVVHVIDPRRVEPAEGPALLDLEQRLAEAPELLRERAEGLSSVLAISCLEQGIKTHARVGQAAACLNQVCVDYDADVLFVGTHARRGLERVLLGSVAEELVKTARCPVVVARPKDYAGLSKSARPDAPYAASDPRSRAHPRVDHEPILSTQSDGWEPSDTAPTGMRIV